MTRLAEGFRLAPPPTNVVDEGLPDVEQWVDLRRDTSSGTIGD